MAYKKDPCKYIKSGKASDLGDIEFRSSWERNIARLLNHLDIKWRYEPKRFYFNSYPESYLPDFFLVDDNPWDVDWLEIKGLWKKGDKRKLLLFAQEYPKESFHVISGKEYRALQKKYSKIVPNWEKQYA